MKRKPNSRTVDIVEDQDKLRALVEEYVKKVSLERDNIMMYICNQYQLLVGGRSSGGAEYVGLWRTEDVFHTSSHVSNTRRYV